jgi:plastocyanin
MTGRNYPKLTAPIMAMVFMAILAIVGCSKNKSTNPNTSPPVQHSSHYHTVSIQGFAFTPSALPIAVGDTVQWTNNDSTPHTVTSDSENELSSSTLGQGQTYIHIFMTAGSFPYHCSIHTSMLGGVTVQ